MGKSFTKNGQAFRQNSGQALIEVLIAISVSAVLTIAAAFTISSLLFTNRNTRHLETAVGFGNELMDSVRSVADANWRNIYDLNKGSGAAYWLNASGTQFAVIEGQEGVLDNDVRNGLVGHWKFDEAITTGTTTWDSSNNGGHGFLANGPTRTATASCEIGTCLDFDGTNDHVNLPTSTVFDVSKITVSAWVVSDVTTADLTSVSRYNNAAPVNGNWILGHGATESTYRFLARIGGANQSAESNAGFSTDVWHHLVGTYDGSTVKLYVDGVERASTAISGSLATSTIAVRIANRDGNTNYWDGKIDDVRVYNRALSADEISRIYSSTIFTRYFYIEDVNRDLCGAGAITTDVASGCGSGPGSTGVALDPSTEKITVAVTWPRATEGVTLSEDVTRSRNYVFWQSDWSGASGQEMFPTSTNVTNINNNFASSTNINTTATSGSFTLSGSAPYPSWGDLYSSVFDTFTASGSAINTIMWQGSKPTGSGVRFQVASANCTNGAGDYPICAGFEDQGEGLIDSVKRYAWNEAIGWIDFKYYNNVYASATQLTGYASSAAKEIALDCATTPNGNICGTSNFKVNRSGATLSGWAWNDAIGWISFNCSDIGWCATSTYSVSVSTSTGLFTGWAWNDIVGWISFNCSDPGLCGISDYKVKVAQAGADTRWLFLGPDGTNSTFYNPSDANTPLTVNPAYHNNHRYVRWRAYLVPGSSSGTTPRVDDVIINWSP